MLKDVYNQCLSGSILFDAIQPDKKKMNLDRVNVDRADRKI